jgi:hypothetical protein
MYRTLFLAVLCAAGCSNKLDAYNDDVDRRPPDDTDAPVVEDTDPPEDTDEEVPVDADGDGFTEDEDCDDGDDTVYPGAPELCDGQDNDCDSATVSDVDADDDADGIRDCEDACPIYVDLHASTSAQNGTFTDPFWWIQDAIDSAAALACDVIRVRPGTYDESIDYLGQDLDIASTDGPGRTIIDGDGTQAVVTFANAETDAAILEGFTVTGGGGGAGGGVYVAGADPIVAGNVITGNVMSSGSFQGGGLYLINSDAYVVDNEISDNEAGVGGAEDGNDGGGIFVRSGAPVIEANFIADNLAGDGGGLWFARSDALVVANFIVGNVADDTDPVKGGQGGGVDVQIGTADFYLAGNVIADNQASTHGGGVAIYEYDAAEGDPWIANNTIAFNEVTDTTYGAGLVAFSTTKPYIVNNAIYGNSGPGVYLNATATFEYNDVYGNTTAYAGDRGTLTGTGGNLAVDPGFVTASNDGDWTNDDFDLSATSGLRGLGDPAIRNADGTRSHIGATGGPYGM